MSDDNNFRQGMPTTRWSLIERGQEGLEEFFEVYRPALLARLVYGMKLNRDDAEDFVQGFVMTQMLESDLLSRADPTKGKFRTLLLTALDRFVAKHFRYEGARKRSPKNGKLLSVDALMVDPPVPPSGDTFDIAWARQTMKQAVTQMQRECEQNQRLDIWEVFAGRMLRPVLHHEEETSYAELVRCLNLDSPSQAFNLLVTAKRTFERCLRSSISVYALSDDRIDEEIADLINVLSNARGLHDGNTTSR